MTLPTTSNASNPEAAGYDVRIGDNYYRLAVSPDRPFDTRTNDLRFNAPDTRINPEDLDTEDPDATRIFSRVSFSGGEGVEFAHDPDEEDAENRFWASEGVDVQSVRGESTHVEMVKAFSKDHEAADTRTIPRYATQFVAAENTGFLAEGNNVAVVDTLTEASPTVTTEDPANGEGGTLHALATSDERVYASGTFGIHRRDMDAETWAHYNDLAADRIWGLAGRIVAAKDASLYEVASSGAAPSPLVTLDNDQEFLCATHAGNAIFAGASNGYIYGLVSVEGQLSLRAQTEFRGEEITALGSVQNIVLIGTKDGSTGRLYVARASGDFTIKGARLLREWDLGSGDAAPAHVDVTRDNGYVAFKEESSQNVVVYKFRLDTLGLFEVHEEANNDGPCTGLRIYQGRLFFSSHGGTNAQLFRQQDTSFKTSGHIISPLADHFTADEKVWVGAKLYAKSIPTNCTLDLYYTVDPDAITDPSHPSWTLVKSYSSPDETEQLIQGAESRWLAVKIEFTGDGTTSPKLRGFAVRAYPGPTDLTLSLPINASDRVEKPGYAPFVIAGLGKDIYGSLKDKEGTSLELEDVHEGDTFRGTIKRVSDRRPQLNEFGSHHYVVVVEFRGRRV